MEDDKLREIIREEIERFVTQDKFVFKRDVQFVDGRKIQTGKGTGTQIATESTQKIGFYGTTPVDQPDAVANANSVGATYSQAEVQDIADKVNLLITRLEDLGLIDT